MLRVTKLTDYATVLLAELARAPIVTLSAAQLSDRTHLSVPTVSKLLKSLGAAGLVTSRRGARGGYALARDPALISAAEVVAAIEGPPAVTQCSMEGGGQCEIEPWCSIASGWQRISRIVQQTLEGVTLAQLVAGSGDLLPHPLSSSRTE